METAALRFLVTCAATHPRSLEGILEGSCQLIILECQDIPDNIKQWQSF